ncbi:MAG: N-acetylmuramoyl-L-alanine amidase [Saprospiraceae bacterium]|nr:N-acetylmuramoyl-L-alanine amidase [Saprospiraceae bacterium]
MRSNFALRTIMLLASWLVLQNFNLPVKVDGSQEAGLMNGSNRGKSMESNSVLSLSAPSNPSYRIKTIVLDAGHGGKDPGCIGASSKEKDNALAIVLHLGALLEANFPELKVIYTRDSDEFIELNERANIANRNNADLFVCVHCNAVSRASISGSETYVLGLHKVAHNLEVAKRENASIYLEDDYEKKYSGYDPDSPEAHIFGSTWQSAYLEQSILLAQYVQQFAHSEAERDDRGVKQAGFLVLKETAMPSVLIETGYLTNATEEQYLASSEGQEEMALAIFKAIRAYKNHMEYGQSSVAAVSNSYVKPVSRKIVVNSTTTSSSKGPGTTAKPEKKQVPSKSPYRIYLLSWPNKLDPNAGQLGLLSDVHEVNEGGKYHYYFGNYSSMEEAEKILPEIRNLGFKTAKIVQ